MSREALIAAPLRVEAWLAGPAAGRSSIGGARVSKTGMGPEHARAAAVRLAGEPGAGVLVLGFCGGLDAESVPGETIVAEAVYAARATKAARTSGAGRVRGRRGPDAERCAAMAFMCAAARSCACRRSLSASAARSCWRVGRSRWTWSRRGWRRARRDGRSRWCASCSTARATSCCVQALAGALRAARALRRVAHALVNDWAPGGLRIGPMAVRGQAEHTHGLVSDAPAAGPAREVPADRRARAAVPVQSCVLGLRQDPASRARAAPADAGRAGDRRDRGVGHADGLDRRGRAADPSRDRCDRGRARQAQEVRVPVH